MQYIYTMKYYSDIEKEWNNAICSNKHGPRDYHTKSEKDTHHMIPLTSGIYKMIQIKLVTKQKWTYRHRKQIYGYQSEKVGESDKLGA